MFNLRWKDCRSRDRTISCKKHIAYQNAAKDQPMPIMERFLQLDLPKIEQNTNIFHMAATLLAISENLLVIENYWHREKRTSIRMHLFDTGIIARACQSPAQI
jgi:hypothetical protein